MHNMIWWFVPSMVNNPISGGEIKFLTKIYVFFETNKRKNFILSQLYFIFQQFFRKTTMIQDEVRQNIKRMRDFKGLSPEQMAEHLHISARAYLDIELGATKLDLVRLEKIAEILDTSLDNLLHLHERSSFNLFKDNELSNCIVANKNVYLIEKELMEDLRKSVERSHELFLQERQERLALEQKYHELVERMLNMGK